MKRSFEEIVSSMSEIAKAVNAFTSETVQQQAFAALIRALELGSPEQQSIVDAPVASRGKATRASSSKASAASSVKKGQKKSSSPKFLGDLDLRPGNKTSLREFCATKKPKDNQERYAVIVFYLTKKLGIAGVSQDHVYTAFKELGLKVPLDIEGAMAVTAKRKGWLDTGSLSTIKLTMAGENFVEHDLPSSAKGKK